MAFRAFRPSLRAVAASALFAGVLFGWISAPRSQEAGERDFSISARKYAFVPIVIEVNQDDLVRITLTTDDIPHSFTVDKYRIAKRVERGKPVVFEFRADQPGRFPIYCSLAIDEKCREMKGELIVTKR
jgi:heme/copper-type cytochrome/quinol oxidase subunit 2